jgi:hypothetical protein
MNKFVVFSVNCYHYFQKVTFIVQLMRHKQKGIHGDSIVGISLLQCSFASWAEPIHLERYAGDCKPVLAN